MKKIIIIILLIATIVGCSGIRRISPRYTYGTTNSVSQLLDSIANNDKVIFPDKKYWIVTDYTTNVGIVKSYLTIVQTDSMDYVLSIIDKDTIQYYNYRVEPSK